MSVVARLRSAGLTLRTAHALINRLADTGLAVCEIAEGAGIPGLAADLARMNVLTNRRQRSDPGVIEDECLYNVSSSTISKLSAKLAV